MRKAIIIASICCAPVLSGCAAATQLLEGLVQSTQGSQWLGSALDLAASGAKAYFARHPNMERQQEVADALHKARLLKQVYDATLATTKALDSGDIEKAKMAAIDGFEALRILMKDFGVLDALAPPGGAEGNAPDPKPFTLPTAAELTERM
jgi:hypothetical protein